MNKKITIAIGMFCTGILLGGIGTGVAIAEYSSLEYTGEHILGQENMKKETLEISLVPEEGKKILIGHHYYATDVRYSEEIPVNTIRYEVTYNPSLVNLRLEYDEEIPQPWEEDEERSRYQGIVRMNSYHFGDEFDLIMKNKDQILNELKQGKIGSYQTRSIDSAVIWMNPVMKEDVEFS